MMIKESLLCSLSLAGFPFSKVALKKRSLSFLQMSFRLDFNPDSSRSKLILKL